MVKIFYNLIIWALLLLVFTVCKEEKSKSSEPSEEKPMQKIAEDKEPAWDAVGGVYGMNDGRIFMQKFNVNSQIKDYCLQINKKENRVDIGLVEGKILSAKLLSLKEKEYFEFELNGIREKYYFVTSVHGGSGKEFQCLMSDEFSKKKEDGSWLAQTNAGSQAAFNTMPKCIAQLKLAIELQYTEKH